MSLVTERRAARERALGLLYEAEAKRVAGAEVLAELPVPADDFATALVRAALRMGTAELTARPDVPTGVVLAETVDLASRFSTDGSGRFVNGLLARVAREVRGEPAESLAPLEDLDEEDDANDDPAPVA